jgi:hypothetical protein
MNSYNNVIITATNSLYYESLLTLISSVHKYSFDIVDHIFVYNLGLDSKQIERLSIIRNLTVLEFTQEAKNTHLKFMDPKSYVYKPYCLHNSKSFGKNILWMDSGACFLKACKTIFNKIENDHIFLVKDTHKNKNFTHNICIKIMNATEKELDDNQMWAGLVGYRADGNYQKVIDQAYLYSVVPGCLDGNQENHRHDQSILSILASRHNCPTQNIDIYGYWTDANRNLTKAREIGSVVFSHRRGYSDFGDILNV